MNPLVKRGAAPLCYRRTYVCGAMCHLIHDSTCLRTMRNMQQRSVPHKRAHDHMQRPLHARASCTGQHQQWLLNMLPHGKCSCSFEQYNQKQLMCMGTSRPTEHITHQPNVHHVANASKELQRGVLGCVQVSMAARTAHYP
jgi:hypothetical protein